MLEYPCISRYSPCVVRRGDYGSDNVSSADNQQERLSIENIPSQLGSFLSGFALGEASFMVVVRKRGDYRRGWRISAAFNVCPKWTRSRWNSSGRRSDVDRFGWQGTEDGTSRSTSWMTSGTGSFRSSDAFRSSDRSSATSKPSAHALKCCQSANSTMRITSRCSPFGRA